MALSGKTAAITGAGSGIGLATARLFAERGANVAAVDVDDEAVEEATASIQDDGPPGEVVAVTADVTDANDVAAFVEATVETFGGIDVLHNNAGILHESASIDRLEEDVWDRTLAVNLKGVYLGAKYAVPHMREGGGAIVNTASIAGVRPREGLSAYVASKGGVIALTKELALELAEEDVRVNAVCPVATRTNIFGGPLSEEAADRLRSTIPWGRLADPEDIARSVAFLGDDEESEMITGSILEVDGGRGI